MSNTVTKKKRALEQVEMTEGERMAEFERLARELAELSPERFATVFKELAHSLFPNEKS